MRLARSFSTGILSLAAALLAAAPALAQDPVPAYTPASRYSTFNLGAQVTGDPEEGRDILFSWGRMRTMGGAGQWMPRAEFSLGFTTGRDLIDGLLAGPSVGFGYAFPSQYMSFGRGTRAEPYLIAFASTYGIGEFGNRVGEDERWGIAPAVSAGVGLRMFSDEWDVDLSTLEIVVEQRLAFDDSGPELYIRFGRAVAPRTRPSSGSGTPFAPIAYLPPPILPATIPQR
jgi:hypothetical protein